MVTTQGPSSQGLKETTPPPKKKKKKEEEKKSQVNRRSVQNSVHVPNHTQVTRSSSYDKQNLWPMCFTPFVNRKSYGEFPTSA